MVICGPQKLQIAPQKNRKGGKHGPQNYWPGDNTVTLSLHWRMYYLPKFDAYIKRWDPQFQWWDPHHIQSWVPRTPKHSTWCKTLLKPVCFVCVNALQVINNFSVMSRHFTESLGWTSTKQRIKCLAQGHNTMPPLSLKLVTLRSQLQV